MENDPIVGNAVDQETKNKPVDFPSIIPKAILSSLREDFPQEAIETVIKDDSFEQTGIKPAWVIERLNDVLGVEGWDTEELEIKENGADIATKVRMNMYVVIETDSTISKVLVATRTQWGSARKRGKQEYGDVLKSAYTNALCKCASMFDVAHKAYKGQLTPNKPRKEELVIDVSEAKAYDKQQAVDQEPAGKPALSSTDPDIRAARKKLRDVAAAKRITRNTVQETSEKHFNKAQSRDLTLEELTQLVDILNKYEVTSQTDGGGYTA